jgi:DNA ligase-1
MRDFARLYRALDASTSTTAKVAALRTALQGAAPEDAAWMVYLLAGGKPRQAVPTAVLRAAACQAAGIDEWLFEECYQVVGDLAETMAHVLPHGDLNMPAGADDIAEAEEPDADTAFLTSDHGLAAWMRGGLLPLRGLDPETQARRLRRMWSCLEADERFLLTKLVGGGFRVGLSKGLVQRAVAEHAGLEPNEVAQRMMGYTTATRQPAAQDWHRLVGAAQGDALLDQGRPYPFFLAQAVEPADEGRMQAVFGSVGDWLVEWKYDGIRAQIVRRGSGVWIWSRGEELITDRFPEVVQAAMNLQPGTVLDGELLVMRQGRPAPFAELQTRITRKTVSKALRERTPVAFMAYDVLELDGVDLRSQPHEQRRHALERCLQEGPFDTSPLVLASDWQALQILRQESRARGVEGFMLKHRYAPYGVGRRKVEGAGVVGWWKWKVQPMTVDAVLVYAQAGHGRRANLYTDYTFAVWSRTPRGEAEVQAVLQAIERRDPPSPDGLSLVPFAKAYSGLSDEEFAAVDRVIRRSTVEKFGPVRSVVPSLVFELGFEGIAASTRHKSGVAVRFPRMLRLRTDKPLREADTLQSLKALHASGE